MKSVANGELEKLGQNKDIRNNSSILLEQHKKPSTSTMNELAAINKWRKWNYERAI
jgi:hypothetical protein